MRELKLVHNDDGCQPMTTAPLGRVREHLENWVDMVATAETRVDAFVGCVAHPEICYYNTKIGERIGTRPLIHDDVPMWNLIRAHDELAAQGTDMLRVMAERCRQRGVLFLAGVRMSDAHHRWGKGYPEDPLYPRFTNEHPELRIKLADGKLDVTLDYSHRAVRELRLSILREIATYPIDGFELDFMRFCSHFPVPATAEQVELMNDFVRDARKLLDDAADSRGDKDRPMLGVRVPPTLAECAPHGLDPATWGREGLIDYLNPANFLWADYNIALDDYLASVRGSNCRVLFPIQPWVAPAWANENRNYHFAYAIELPEFRAMAANGYAAGAHGMHSFNLACELPGRKEKIAEALGSIATPDGPWRGERHYQYFPSDPGATITGANFRQTLRFSPANLNTPQVFRFRCAEGTKRGSKNGRLAWRIYHATTLDGWSFALNGRPIDTAKLHVEPRYAGYPPRTGVELPAHAYFEIALRDAPPLALSNELSITPRSIESGVRWERIMEVLEIWAS